MKERRRGFTLIELLAVIVILAIIALIATPIVLNLINTARKGAFARSAEGVLKASKLYYTSSLVEEVNTTTQEFTCDNKECLSNDGTKLDVDGNMGEGTVTITSDGKISFELGNGTYCAEKEEDSDKITVTKKKCGELVINIPTNLQITYTSSKAGEVTVIGKVSNKPAEIETCEFSIDDGNTWEKATLVGNAYMYTFKGLGVNETYTVKMRVTNKNNETAETNKDVKTATVIMEEPKITPKNKEWSVSKTVELVYPNIDTNVYKKVYSLDGGNTFVEYQVPIVLTQNGNIVVDIIKISDNTSILEKKQTVNITKVDSSAPTLSSLTVISKTSDSITVEAEGIDDESGIYGYSFSKDGGMTFEDIVEQPSNKSKVTYTFEHLKNGSYNIVVRTYNNTYLNDGEKVENYLDSTVQTEATLSIPIPTYDTIQSGWSQSKNVNITYYGNYVNEYCTDVVCDETGTWHLYNGTIKFTSNGTIVARSRDNSNNIAMTSIQNISQIDTTSPTVSNIKSVTVNGKNIEVEAEGTDLESGIGYYQFSNDGGKTWEPNVPQTKSIYTFENQVPGKYEIMVKVINNTYLIEKVVNDKNFLNSTSQTVQIKGEVKFKDISASTSSMHILAIDTDGNLWSWGYNDRGQLGNKNATAVSASHSPIQIMKGTIVQSISTGYAHSGAIDTSGNLWMWGYNNNYQLGNGTTKNTSVPQKIDLGVDVTILELGNSFTTVVDSSGNRWFWGDTGHYQSGDGTISIVKTPTIKNFNFPISNITCGRSSCVALSDNNLYGWGSNSYGAGGSSGSYTTTPQQIAGSYVAIASGTYHNMAIDTAGNIWTIGDNSYGQLGNKSTTSSKKPVKVIMPTGVTFANIAAGNYTSVAIDSEGNLWTWGRNNYGQLGNGTSGDTNVLVPTKITSGIKFIKVQLNDSTGVALTEDGYLYTWGSFYTGNGSSGTVLTPTKITVES